VSHFSVVPHACCFTIAEPKLCNSNAQQLKEIDIFIQNELFLTDLNKAIVTCVIRDYNQSTSFSSKLTNGPNKLVLQNLRPEWLVRDKNFVHCDQS